MPEPEDGEHLSEVISGQTGSSDGPNLVIDDVEGEDTDGVLTGLTSTKSAESDVVAGGDLGEDLAHRVEGGVE